VIHDLQSDVRGVEWIETSDAKYVAASCGDRTVGMLKVVVVDGQYQLRLHWRTTKGGLYVDGAIIQDVQGLSRLNKELLKQRGSVGEPADHFRDAAKTLTSIASVVSKLKATPRGNGGNPVESAIGPIGLETRVEQTSDPEVQGFAVSFMQTLKDRRDEVREILGWTSQQNDAISS
jgi:hypothetical protein